MKKLLMPIFALALAFGLCSCEEKNTPEPQPQTTLEFAESTVVTTVFGGACSVAYTVTNPVEGAHLNTPTSNSEWVNNFTITDSEIQFNVDPNEEGIEREAVVTVTYSANDATATFRVSQQGGTLDPFTVEVTEVTEAEVYFNVIPTDKTMTYVALTVTEEHAGSLTEDELFESLLAHYKIYADAEGMGIGQYLEYYDQLHQGDLEGMYYNRLTPETNYYIVVVGLSVECEKLSDIFLSTFTTTEVQLLDITLDVSATCSGSTATITVVPSDNDIQYYVEAVRKSAVDASEVGLQGAVEQLIQMYIMYGEMGGQSMEEVLASLLKSGRQSIQKSVDPSTEYVAFAVAVNKNGYLCSEIFEYVFTSN